MATLCLYSIGLLLLGFFDAVESSDYCGNLKWCSSGHYCCNYNTDCCTYALGGGSIAGITVGACAVGIICVVVCIVCMRRRSHTGVVVAQSNPAASGVVVATTTVPYQTATQPGYKPQGFQPPPYAYPAPYGQQVPNPQFMNEQSKYVTAPPGYT